MFILDLLSGIILRPLLHAAIYEVFLMCHKDMVVNLRRIIFSSRFNDVMCLVIIYSKEHVHSIVTTNILYRTSYQL